ncbi:exonuclease domain-containing protein [Nitrosovibrio tenuis]|uniref:DNA-directed DNA polymerase n=1 Tax=Nitrosovibrio tenuis TaxID=1233 RepID=A0A1H7RMU5_9PROT|nr:exonuclease domain-containing protein [Nitrosovibrio tenuis]SEL61465.1 DNA polymerase-3 subunit epsilon [Nitrosovibrio tenuis]
MFSCLHNCVILDLETTGGTPLYDRITEIALIRFEDGIETERWETLVNPGISIPPFISRLTGITNDMVRDAPFFEDIADKLYGYIEGAVLAAHNVRFDHGFLKAEFKRLGAVLRQRVMCTVKLSRTLYPQHRGHGLDAIMHRHGLISRARHRAMGDVELVVAYFELVKRELGEDGVLKAVASLLKGPSLPAGLDAAFLDEIPDGPGVYLFYGENDLPLYIGKSIALRSRVMSHFNSDHASSKDMRIGQQLTRVDWIETAGELGALLLESMLIKERQPIHNRRLRSSRDLFSLSLADGLNQVPLVNIVTGDYIDPALFEYLYGLFRSKKAATEALRRMAIDNRLCPRMIGIESGKGACFAQQLKRCDGVCAGRESPELHYLRLKQALVPYLLKGWPYSGKIGIRELNEDTDRSELHIFENWCHIGTVEDEAELDEILRTRTFDRSFSFDLDIYNLLQRSLNKYSEIISLESHPARRRVKFCELPGLDEQAHLSESS